MRLPDDDELYEVDQTYLGPPRRYIGEMRYRTIFLFLVIAPVTLVLLRKLGMPVTLLSMGLWLLGASFLSMKASDYISAESSAGAWLMTFWHELTTPRVETGMQYAGGAAAAFRHATRPRGGWAKAMRRPGRRFAQQPGATSSPRLMQATVVASTPSAQSRRAGSSAMPVRGKAAPVRPVIEAKVVEDPLPAHLSVQPQAQAQPQARSATQAAGGGRPAKGGWSSRPSSSPREPRDVPWKGGAPWQAREGANARSAQRPQPAAPQQAPAQPPAPAPEPPAPQTPAPQTPAAKSSTPAPPPPPVIPTQARTARPTAPPPPPPTSAGQQTPPTAQPTTPPKPPIRVEPKVTRQPLSHAVKPAVVIAPEPGLADPDELDDAPSGRTRPRGNPDEQAMPAEHSQRTDDYDYRKRLDGDAPNDGGTA
ncbi:hypothetical protein WBG06_09120 [Nocardioides sp. CCNWLW239]|uniref:hypothetical protein n=1 Tax=Nocardioides sp. CCNWLW239 TaxID=3128902 RepID=UPI00301B4EA0